jgi:hypothetical protein
MRYQIVVWNNCAILILHTTADITVIAANKQRVSRRH